MKNFLLIILSTFIVLFTFSSCTRKQAVSKNDFVIAKGQMPKMVTDKNGNIHLVYGIGDSIMYTYSSDKGNSFSSPEVIDVVMGLYSFATRGPQIAATPKGILVTACTAKGNIYSYYKTNGNWQKGARVNDQDTVAKEGLMALSADGNNAFAVWLDIRGNTRNKIVGAHSEDGGKSWSKNQIIYASPDSVVCPCCKPSVKVKGENVFVMFRNWLNGNRDLYLSKSSDGGASFSNAEKLGNNSWKLDGCPMDGGGLAVNNDGKVQTVWRRKDKIYSDVPGNNETELGKGRNCTVASVDDNFVYAWSDSSKIKLMQPDGKEQTLGNGMLPVLTPVDKNHVICAWENEKQIHVAVVKL